MWQDKGTQDATRCRAELRIQKLCTRLLAARRLATKQIVLGALGCILQLEYSRGKVM